MPAGRDAWQCLRLFRQAAIAIGIALFLAASIATFSEPGPSLIISTAFAKKKGKDGLGKSKSGRKGNRNGKRGSVDAEDESESEDGDASDGEDPGSVNDFHDEGFVSPRNRDIRLGRDRDHDFGDRRHKNNLNDGLGYKDKPDLKFLKENLREGFGFSDKIDLKSLSKGLGDAEEYVRPRDADGAGRRGQMPESESRPQEKNRISGGRENAGNEDEAPPTKKEVKELGLDAKPDLKSLSKDLGDAEDFVMPLDAGGASNTVRAAGGDSSAPEKGASSSAEKANKKSNPELQTLSDQKDELKAAISDLKEERKDAATKEEKKELKQEIKSLKSDLKDVKQAIKEVKGAVPEQNAETAIARSDKGGLTVQPIGMGTYASKEVLALGLSAADSTRVRSLGFQVGGSALEYGGTTLRTLFVPERMDALQALRLLQRELASGSFHLNRLYRPYHPSKNDNLENEQRHDPGLGGRNCLGDKCYSRTLIHWKDDLTKCTQDVGIGVIDTEIDLRHPTFAGRKIVQNTFLSEGKKASPNWHGTGILALLAGHPDSGTPGLVPDAKFFVASSFFLDDNGEAVTDTVSLLRSLEWMGASGVRVINMSFAGPDDVLMQGRIKTLRSKGVLFTAAAGNDGPVAAPNYPAAYPEVVAVTAVTKDMRIYPSANRGAYIDFAAPGVRIWTALPGGREGYRTGTSFATPFATAVLALQRPDSVFDPDDTLLDHLNAVPLGPGGRNPIYGRGLLQAPTECPGPGTTASGREPAPIR